MHPVGFFQRSASFSSGFGEKQQHHRTEHEGWQRTTTTLELEWCFG
ncbi:hypothetical protein HanIR_Chr15g0738311 [Helianthus annuus]|nr:hypothetical protein HanIR_Chr15g0738311 [Helianthus annuus]